MPRAGVPSPARPASGLLLRALRSSSCVRRVSCQKNVVLIGRLPQPVGDRRFDLVTMSDANDVRELRRSTLHDAADLRRPQRASQHDADLEIFRLRPHEEVTDLPREHDRVVRGVDALVAEFDCRLPDPIVGILQVLGQILGQRRLRRRPAVMRLAFINPLLAVVTLVARHFFIVWTSLMTVF